MSNSWTIWTSVASLGLAAYATVQGERRAHRARLARQERLSYDWRFEWTAPSTISITNIGLDEARAVVIRVTFERTRTEHTFKRVRGDEVLVIDRPELRPHWEAIERRATDPDFRGFPTKLSAGQVGITVDWRTPAGTPMHAEPGGSLAHDPAG